MSAGLSVRIMPVVSSSSHYKPVTRLHRHPHPSVGTTVRSAVCGLRVHVGSHKSPCLLTAPRKSYYKGSTFLQWPIPGGRLTLEC